EADRRLAEWAQRVDDALTPLRMAAPGSGQGVEERGARLVVGGVLVRKKKGTPVSVGSPGPPPTPAATPVEAASPTAHLRSRVAAREEELARTLPAPNRLRVKAALCLAGGAVAGLAAGAAIGLAGVDPGTTRELVLIAAGLIPGALAAGVANKAMQGVQDKTQLGLSMATTMLGSFLLAAAAPGGNPIAIGIISAASIGLSALVARGFQSTYHGVPARLQGLTQTLDRFDELSQLQARLQP
ncbi:MAG: hypothetical protein AB1758_26450, partial [Candidatus Eremiobacterota bacterium]